VASDKWTLTLQFPQAAERETWLGEKILSFTDSDEERKNIKTKSLQLCAQIPTAHVQDNSWISCSQRPNFTSLPVVAAQILRQKIKAN